MFHRISSFRSRGATARRLVKGFGANLLGKFWIAAVQLLLVPVLISAWGADGYGAWLMLTTIPLYILLTDFGMGNALAVELTRAITRKDEPMARRALQSVWVFMCLISGVVLMIALAAVLLWPTNPEVGPFPSSAYRIAIMLVVIEALAGLQQAVLRAVFHATHRFALETFQQSFSIPASGVLVAIAASSGQGVVIAAAASALVRIAMVVAYGWQLARLEPWSRLGWAAADRNTFRRLMSPSLSALTLSLSNALGVQGVLLTIGWTLGPAAAGIYGAARMLTRIPLQFSGLLVRASLPELTRSQEAGNTELTRRLVRLNMRLTLASALPVAFVLAIFGPYFLSLLSKGALVADHLLFVFLGAAAAICTIWTTLSQPLVALNRQGEFAYIAVLCYGLVALQPLVLHQNLSFAAGCALLAEVTILLVVFRRNTAGSRS